MLFLMITERKISFDVSPVKAGGDVATLQTEKQNMSNNINIYYN